MWLSGHSDGFLDHLSCWGEKIKTCMWNLDPSLKTKPPDCFFLRGCRRRHLPVCQPPSSHQPVAAECRWVSERDGAPLITGRHVINGGGAGGRSRGPPFLLVGLWIHSFIKRSPKSVNNVIFIVCFFPCAFFFPFCFWVNEWIYFWTWIKAK